MKKQRIVSLMLLGFLFGNISIPKLVNATENEYTSPQNEQSEKQLKQKKLTLQNVKKILEKSNDLHLYPQAKDEIEQIYSNRSSIQLRSSGHGGLSDTEHSTTRIYLENGGIVAHSILGGRMKILTIYFSREQALNFSREDNEMFKFLIDRLSFVLDVGTFKVCKPFLILSSLYKLHGKFIDNIKSEIKNNKNVSLFHQTIEDQRSGEISHSLAPWYLYPFIDISGYDYYEVFKK